MTEPEDYLLEARDNMREAIENLRIATRNLILAAALEALALICWIVIGVLYR